ncbi:MAG: biopolymer transporter ExbD [Opitutales bacterium]|nr:biopolymer transporter ExbD [Opitutales bacterium]
MDIDFKSPTDTGIKSDLTPLIDVIFQLLVFFILTSSFLYPNLSLTLPQTERQAEATEKQPLLVVNVDSSGGVFINSTAVPLEHLETELGKMLQGQSKKQVHLRADKSTPYEEVLRIMVSARNAGAENIYFIHEE